MSRSPEHDSAQVLHPAGPMRWVRARDAVWRSSLDRVIVSVPQHEDLLILTGAAAELWHALAEPVTVDGLGRRMSAAFDGSAEVIAADLTSPLEELARRGAVRTQP